MTAPAFLEVGPEHPALAGRTGAGVTVAILDSGVNPGHPHLGGIVDAVALDDRGRLHPDALDRLGHGTAVAAAIHEKAPGAALHVVKVFDRTLSTTILALVDAIDRSVDRGVRLVNLSLGTVKEEHAPLLEEAVARAREAGTLVVSARGRQGVTWYPGALAGVAGVDLDPACPRDALRITPEGTFVAAPWARPIPGVPVERNIQGVSFAVANVTGVLARALEGRPGVGTVEGVIALLGEGDRRGPA